ncbi:MAG: dolichol-P-glucose synthetase [Candidatus Gottesmanbacteria bacterium GW2011_GWA2_43_14]|uniref:Dolichol-P-glucose synthetase n=1 Tax=Candidatus Gottesmanbacteria bacterium GW2011_GWA2_43_14 TaxID=1618443 RepID=A0A0G1DM97_9BACT|nr:MAG: dolichol-P-glucose synthetase [Candidatus Gottesmanbacteria bacterium GW2011_GWA2_43_14]
MTDNSIYLSVIIPCYNEARNIRLGALESVDAYLKKQKYAWEVIMVDDGSNDDSPRLLKSVANDKKNFFYYRKKHQGKAAAVTYGVMKAEGAIILFTDLDQATPLNQIEKLFPLFGKGCDLVIGSRNNERRGAPLLRLAMAKGFMLARNIILNLNIRDTQCGFKAFTSECGRLLFPKLKVFDEKRRASGSAVSAGFDIELLYLAKKKGFRIAEVPIEWHYQETRNVNPVKDSLESLYDLLRIKFNSSLGKYDA